MNYKPDDQSNADEPGNIGKPATPDEGAVERLTTFAGRKEFGGQSGYDAYPGGIFMTDGPNPFYADLRTILAQLAETRAALTKIDAIRNSIIGCQKVNWSEHVYPLVVALQGAGYEGADYETNRKNVGTLIERTNAAEVEVARLKAEVNKLTLEKAMLAGHESINTELAEDVRNERVRADALQANNEKLRAAVETCGKRFRFYERQHAARGTPEADAKAQSNADMAEVCARALCSPQESPEVGGVSAATSKSIPTSDETEGGAKT